MPGMKVTPKHIKRAEIYLANYQDYGVMPSVLRMARMMGVNRKTLQGVKHTPPRDDDHSEQAMLKRQLIEILDLAHDMQHDILVEGGLTGDLNSNIVKLALTRHGYSDKQELTGQDGGAILTDNKWTVEFVEAKE